jgi:hypothetical protein
MANGLVRVNIDSFTKSKGGPINRLVDGVVNKLEDKLENAVEDLFAKTLKKVGFSDAIAAQLSARFGDSLTAGLEDKYFQTFTSEMKRASCADIRNNFNPQNGNIIGASAFAETYVDAIQRASNKIKDLGAPTMQFPDHISEKYYMAFKFKQYQRPSPQTAGSLAFVQAFALPLPKGLRESFDIEVGQEATGLAGGIADAAQLFLKSDTGAGRTQALTNSAAALAYSALVQSTGDIGGVTAQAIGAVPNPHVQALFSGVPLRTHRFEWTFAPRNREESQQLMNLLKAMKAYALPSYSSLGTAALAYPFLCQPELKINNKSQDLIKFQPCLIQSIELNYSPQGIPAFFEGTSDPAFIECSITMLETQIQTARDYGREGGDRLSETWETLKKQIQKGLKAAGSDFDIDKKQNEIIKATKSALSSNEERRN